MMDAVFGKEQEVLVGLSCLLPDFFEDPRCDESFPDPACDFGELKTMVCLE
jgi:hypothetical protein